MKMTSILKEWLLERVSSESGWSEEYRKMLRGSIMAVPYGTDLLPDVTDLGDGNSPLEMASVAADYFGARSSVEP